MGFFCVDFVALFGSVEINFSVVLFIKVAERNAVRIAVVANQRKRAPSSVNRKIKIFLKEQFYPILLFIFLLDYPQEVTI